MSEQKGCQASPLGVLHPFLFVFLIIKLTIMKKISYIMGLFLLLWVISSCSQSQTKKIDKPCYSGIYPHLAYYNEEGECGTGAVVPWQDKLYVVTYGPHLPYGSSDKLYVIDDTLGIVTRPESVGGTPADRLIHRESNQLFIGPYAVDAEGNVRVISYKEAQGRYTGAARHLTDPAGKIYIATMEEGFYEIDVNDLTPTTLYPDANGNGTGNGPGVNPVNELLPGAHGKGLYSGQGVLVFANNGEATQEALWKFDCPSGVLAEWNGKDWTVVRRNQFTEVTGPGGIYGNPNPETDPLWSIGWDHRSILLALRDNGSWKFYRLPKASNSYDGAHGWNTEWPRIRNIGTDENPDYLMTMHGMFWHFPQTFATGNTAGIRPRSAYLKVVGDFAPWKGKVVIGCDDTAKEQFLNIRPIKGNIGGSGQSNSNLWFVEPQELDQLGTTTATGSVWLRDNVKKGEASEPMLFAGWSDRCLWLRNDSETPVNINIEVDKAGNGKWSTLRTKKLGAGKSAMVSFNSIDEGEWVRLTSDKDATLSATFAYTEGTPRHNGSTLFNGVATIDKRPTSQGLLYALGNNRRALGILAQTPNGEKYYELSGDMKLVTKDDNATAEHIRHYFTLDSARVTITDGSVMVDDTKGRHWHLPLGKSQYTNLTKQNTMRLCREVVTERDLMNLHGTFYELPAENADGYAKIRPIASHNLRINDYASYRGLLVLSGIDAGKVQDNDHIITSEDGDLQLWVGAIDDLWKLGKPVGQGGPWVDTQVWAGSISEPYLIGGYDKRKLNISHKGNQPVKFTIEVDPDGSNNWVEYMTTTVKPGQSFLHNFSDAFEARWIRFKTDAPCVATTWLEYN